MAVKFKTDASPRLRIKGRDGTSVKFSGGTYSADNDAEVALCRSHPLVHEVVTAKQEKEKAEAKADDKGNGAE